LRKRIDVIFDLSGLFVAVADQKMMGKHYAVAIPNMCGNSIEVSCHFCAGNCYMNSWLCHFPFLK
jgi:hypothetical protein